MGLGSKANVTLALVRSRQVDTTTSDPTDVLLGALVHIWPAGGYKVLVFDLKHIESERSIFPHSPIHLDLPCISFL